MKKFLTIFSFCVSFGSLFGMMAHNQGLAQSPAVLTFTSEGCQFAKGSDLSNPFLAYASARMRCCKKPTPTGTGAQWQSALRWDRCQCRTNSSRIGLGVPKVSS